MGLELLGGLAAGFIAGAINSVAGGGTMVSFPLLIFFGLPPMIANATNTLGIWPGAIGSVWGFRAELRTLARRYFWLTLPAALGGAWGAWLLHSTPASDFERIVPWLLLSATLLFFAQPFVRTRLGRSGNTKPTTISFVFSNLLLFGVAVYGGYFGAGMSILMLSILGLIGLSDLLQMTATTSMLSILINGLASVVFILAGLVQWTVALPMMVGSVLGGYLAASWARHLGKTVVRRFVLAMAVIMTVALFWRIFQ